MALWFQELQVIHYCHSARASGTGRENTEQKKKKERNAGNEDQILQCRVCLTKETGILPIPWWEAIKFEGNNMVRVERSLCGAKKRNWAEYGVSQAQEKDKLIGWFCFFCPSWCPLFPLTPSTPYLFPLLSDHIGFHVERRLLIFLWAPGYNSD